MLTPLIRRLAHRRTITAALGLVLVGAVDAVLSGQQPSAYDAGQRAFREKDFRVAAEKFAEAEKVVAGHSDAALFLAKSLVQLRRFDDAGPVLGRYLQSHPQDSDGLFLQGYLLFRQNHAAASLEAYTSAAELAAPRADDLKIVALDYVLLHDDAAAIRWLKRSLQMDAGDAEVWYFLGRAYFTQSQFAEAEAAFREALRIDPAQIRARNNLGLTYEAENRVPEALQEYEETVARDRAARAHRTAAATSEAAETEVQPYLNLGTLLVLQNRSPEAVAILREATTISSFCVPCHLQLGRALAREGRFASALVELQFAVKMKPEDAALHYELGLLYQRSGEKAAAKLELDRSKELFGNHSGEPPVP